MPFVIRIIDRFGVASLQSEIGGKVSGRRYSQVFFHTLALAGFDLEADLFEFGSLSAFEFQNPTFERRDQYRRFLV